jgi:CheY-like chemotaxis protein
MHVVTATNRRDALDEAFARLPDAIVLDLSMPEIDGWEACRRLKADERTNRIPILAVTGHALKGTQASVRAVGCAMYLVKPCLPDQLLDAISKLIPRRVTSAALAF